MPSDLLKTAVTMSGGFIIIPRPNILRSHDSMQAALMCQHGTNDADRAVAEGLAAKVEGEQATDDDWPHDADDGPRRFPRPSGPDAR
jgi:hypothetical protein